MFPRWISWVILLAVGYVVFSASRTHVPTPTVQPVKPLVPAITENNFPALAEATDIERWKRTIDPSYAAKMNCTLDAPKVAHALLTSVIENAAGEGEEAACGGSITIHLIVWGAGAEKVYEGDTKLALGSRELGAGFDHGLLGIKPGGERLLLLPPYALMRNKIDKPMAAAKFLPAGKLVVVTVRRLH